MTQLSNLTDWQETRRTSRKTTRRAMISSRTEQGVRKDTREMTMGDEGNHQSDLYELISALVVEWQNQGREISRANPRPTRGTVNIKRIRVHRALSREQLCLRLNTPVVCFRDLGEVATFICKALRRMEQIPVNESLPEQTDLYLKLKACNAAAKALLARAKMVPRLKSKIPGGRLL